VAVATLTLAFAMAASATAGWREQVQGVKGLGQLKAYVPDSLLSAIQQNPKQTFDVIVSGDRSEKSSAFVQKITQSQNGNNDENVDSNDVTTEFNSITGGNFQLTGLQILWLARSGVANAIVANETVERSSVELPYYNKQLWAYASGAPVNWVRSAPDGPAIAVIDSGVDASHPDLSGQVVGDVNLASLTPNSPGDGQGHGTFVAGIASGVAAGFAGAAPKAKIVSVDVMNDYGQSTVADVIKGVDWVLANKAKYNIRVANLSLHATNRASILFDPLDQAVERLWLNGVVVVAAAGNYAVNGVGDGVQFAPGNDPFIITVGASDIAGTVPTADDFAAPWSAWGYTGDGFMKPDLGAPGRYMIGPVSAGATLALQRPDKVVQPGYMQLSGTSFSAPVVAGAAASIIANHPDWTPDQVKGALMVSAQPTAATGSSLGVGAVAINKARRVTSPPNPNAGLNQFVSTAPDGSKVFNAAAWQSAALASAAWNSVAWSSAAWSSAAWSSAAWSSAAWSSVAWASVAWGSAAWSDVAWSSAAWSSAARADNAAADAALGLAPTAVNPTAQDAAVAALGIVDPICDPTRTTCVAPAPAPAVAPAPAPAPTLP
jgi:serine protease AprX